MEKRGSGRWERPSIAMGASTGGMGTAWGDVDSDGRLDLFVATFQNEPKSLYRDDGGVYTDLTNELRNRIGNSAVCVFR